MEDKLKEDASLEEEIKDLKIRLTTAENKASFITSNLKGELKAIILRNKEWINITMESELGYMILSEKNHSGVHYIPITIAELSPQAHKRNFTASRFFLNEKLIIYIESSKPTQEVEIILRF